MSTDPDRASGLPLRSPRTALCLWAVRVLLTVAILGAGYLAWVSLANGPVAGCGPQSGCNKVLQSRWAYWLNIPVSLPALVVYLGFLAATFYGEKRPESEARRRAWEAIIVLSVMVAGAAGWFIALQAVVIKAFCKFCMAAHLCGFTAALLALLSVPRRSPAPDAAGFSLFALARLALVGVMGVSVLVGGQTAVKKKRYLVKPVSGIKGVRLLSVYEGQFWLKLDELPVLGPPDAPKVVVSLYDYTCPHCRELHPMLVQAQRRFSNQLAVVSLATPLSTNCNPVVTNYYLAHTQACDYAKLALAVWRAKAAAFREYDDWLFKSAQAPALEEAKERAERLVGRLELERALADNWIPRQIQTNSYLYQTNFLRTGKNVMPELMFGPAVTFGPLNDVNDLYKLLEQYLDLK